MIAIIQPLHAGNALRLFIEPPPGSVRWKVLRKGSDTFSGHDDPSALVAYEGDDRVIVDSSFLQNEVMAFYRPFYTVDGQSWTAGPSANGTPSASYQEQSTDVLGTVRDRLEAGLKIEVERGNIQTELGYVQVFTSSPSLDRDLQFPLVTLHLENEEPTVRAIGEYIGGDEFDAIEDEWNEQEGWLASVRLTIIGWSLNADERSELRQALRRIIIGNLPLFRDQGWEQIDLSQQHFDAVSGEYNAPIFQVMNTFSCLAPVVVAGSVQPIREVISRRTNE